MSKRLCDGHNTFGLVDGREVSLVADTVFIILRCVDTDKDCVGGSLLGAGGLNYAVLAESASAAAVYAAAGFSLLFRLVVQLSVLAEQVVEELGGRFDAGHEEMVTGARAGDVEKVALGGVDLVQFSSA